VSAVHGSVQISGVAWLQQFETLLRVGTTFNDVALCPSRQHDNTSLLGQVESFTAKRRLLVTFSRFLWRDDPDLAFGHRS